MRFWTALATTAALAACGGGEPALLNIGGDGRSPDEFAILPNQPLEAPPDFSTLPPPAPGAASRADRQPLDEAVLALGGNPRGGTGADRALVATAGRFGVQDGIREVLASEDLAFRRANDGRLLERLFNVNVYYRAYAPLSLDQERELRRLRGLGVRTVAAPPDPALLVD